MSEDKVEGDTSLKRVSKKNTEKALAIKLHELLCPNTVDEFCSWDWEYQLIFTKDSRFPTTMGDHDWSREGHKRYLSMASQMIKTGMPEAQILTIVKLSFL